MELSSEKLPFLDILICKENTEVYTDIYYKGTDSHQYLHFFMPSKTCQTEYTICISKKNMHHCKKRRHQKHSTGRTRNLSNQPKLPKETY